MIEDSRRNPCHQCSPWAVSDRGVLEESLSSVFTVITSSAGWRQAITSTNTQLSSVRLLCINFGVSWIKSQYPDLGAVCVPFYGVGSTRLCGTSALQASCGSMPARPPLLTSVFTHSDNVFLAFLAFLWRESESLWHMFIGENVFDHVSWGMVNTLICCLIMWVEGWLTHWYAVWSCELRDG